MDDATSISVFFWLPLLSCHLQPAYYKWSWSTMSEWRNTAWKCFTRKARTLKLCTGPVWPTTTWETSRRPCSTWRSHTNRSHQVSARSRRSVNVSSSLTPRGFDLWAIRGVETYIWAKLGRQAGCWCSNVVHLCSTRVKLLVKRSKELMYKQG